MLQLQTNSYNLDVAKVFSVCTAVFLSCVDSEYKLQERNKSISVDNSISLSRAEIYARTGLDDDEQIEIESALQECKILVVEPLKNIPNKNYYYLNTDLLDKVSTAKNPVEVLGNEKAQQFVRQPRVEPISKRQNRIIQLKNKVSISNPTIKQCMYDWIDAIYSNPKGFLSPTGVSIAQQTLLAYASDNQEKQTAVLKIAADKEYRDITWAITEYEKQFGTGTDIMNYNDKTHTCNASSETF